MQICWRRAKRSVRGWSLFHDGHGCRSENLMAARWRPGSCSRTGALRNLRTSAMIAGLKWKGNQRNGWAPACRQQQDNCDGRFDGEMAVQRPHKSTPAGRPTPTRKQWISPSSGRSAGRRAGQSPTLSCDRTITPFSASSGPTARHPRSAKSSHASGSKRVPRRPRSGRRPDRRR